MEGLKRPFELNKFYALIDKELQEQNEKVASKDDFPINWIDRVSLFLSHTIKYLIPVIVIVMMYEIFYEICIV